MTPATPANQALGTLYGQACGDALGTTVEFASAIECKRRFPNGLRKIIGGGAFRVVPGQVTDDTEMALALARTLVSEGTYSASKVFESYQAWAKSRPIDMGCATGAALLRGQPNKTTEANGALMRVSPLGVFCWLKDPLLTARLGRQDASLTHPAKICQDASGIYAATIARCIRMPGQTNTQHFDFAVELAKDLGATECLEDLRRAGAGIAPVSAQGHVRVAFTLAYLHLICTPTFEAAMVDTVMRGGDADTNGAIVGALMGAHLGFASIPKQWVDTVREAEVKRPKTYQATDLASLTWKLMTRA